MLPKAESRKPKAESDNDRAQVIKRVRRHPAGRHLRPSCVRLGPDGPLTVPVYYCPGNKPGIQSLASLAGKLSRKGVRCVSDFSAPTACSSAVTFRA